MDAHPTPQDLNPICGPERLDWCDNKQRRQVQAVVFEDF